MVSYHACVCKCKSIDLIAASCKRIKHRLARRDGIDGLSGPERRVYPESPRILARKPTGHLVLADHQRRDERQRGSSSQPEQGEQCDSSDSGVPSHRPAVYACLRGLNLYEMAVLDGSRIRAVQAEGLIVTSRGVERVCERHPRRAATQPFLYVFAARRAARCHCAARDMFVDPFGVGGGIGGLFRGSRSKTRLTPGY